MSKLPRRLLDHIRTEAGKLEHGEITIHLRGKGRAIDVDTRKSKRFEKDPPEEKKEMDSEFKKG